MTLRFISPLISPTIVTLACTLGMIPIAVTPTQPAIAADYGSMAAPLTFREEVLKLVNLERKRVNAPPLVLNRPLNNAAQNHSDEMALRGILAQTLPSGGPLDRRVKLVGYPAYSTIDQNIGRGSSSAAAAVSGWMGDRVDRAKILDPKFKDLGVGLRRSDDLARKCEQGKPSQGPSRKSNLACTFMSGYQADEAPSPYYWTQIFGTAK